MKSQNLKLAIPLMILSVMALTACGGSRTEIKIEKATFETPQKEDIEILEVVLAESEKADKSVSSTAVAAQEKVSVSSTDAVSETAEILVVAPSTTVTSVAKNILADANCSEVNHEIGAYEVYKANKEVKVQSLEQSLRELSLTKVRLDKYKDLCQNFKAKPSIINTKQNYCPSINDVQLEIVARENNIAALKREIDEWDKAQKESLAKLQSFAQEMGGSLEMMVESEQEVIAKAKALNPELEIQIEKNGQYRAQFEEAMNSQDVEAQLQKELAVHVDGQKVTVALSRIEACSDEKSGLTYKMPETEVSKLK